MIYDISTGIKPYLYIFLDESGDFNFTNIGTRFFTFTTLTRTRPFPWDNPLLNLKYTLIEQGEDIEYFHATENSQAVRDQVFKIISANLRDTRLDSLIVEKPKVGPALYPEERFYPRMVGYLLRYVTHPLNLKNFSEVIVITDSLPIAKKRNVVEKAIKQTLAGMLPRGTNYKVLHYSSRSIFSLQVADYCNWAIFRKWERGDERSYNFIRSAIYSEFDIFRGGIKFYY